MQKLNKFCRYCGQHFWARSADKQFCSDACKEAGHIRRPAWNKGTKGVTGRQFTGEARICAKCGTSFYVQKSKAERFAARYCSTDCYLADRWGDAHSEIRTCPICQKQFRVNLTKKQVCCSLECRRKHYSNIRQGEQSHLWRGGRAAPYHKDWKAARRVALERDGHKCAICGSTDRIQVHHVTPYRYSHSHAPENLKTLCRSCHSREELRVNPSAQAGLDLGRGLRTKEARPVL